MKSGMEHLQEKLRIITDSRASAVLYRFLINKHDKGEFVLPVNVCPVVAEIVKHAGFTPLYVDIDKQNLCLDLNKTSELLNRGIKGMLINHTYGVEIDFGEDIKQLRSNWEGIIIEDKCLCVPTLIANANADLTLFSTGYAKVVELHYGGGLGIAKNEHSFESEKQLLKLVDNKIIRINDFNVNTDSYCSDIKREIKSISLQKKLLNQIYADGLSDISLESRFNNWRYHIMVENKEQIIKAIFNEKLFVSSHYKPLSDDYQKFEVAWNLYNSVLNLFNDNYFDTVKARKLVDLIRKHIQ